jgi:hypothetical protein
MRRIGMRALMLLPLAFLLVACGQAVEPGPGGSGLPSPSAVPSGAVPVRTSNLATVMDTGEGPELCLGAVAESYPPQCGGPPIRGWSWAEHGRGTHDTVGTVRWGMYALTGTWDGTSFTVEDAVPAALYDPAAPPPEPTLPPGDTSEDRLVAIQEELRTLPGYLGGYPQEGRLLAEVMYDDGTIQAWLDQEYGEGVVRVSSALVPASG